MQTTAEIFAVGQKFTGPDGQEWELKPPTGIQQGQFSRWLEERVHAAIDRGPESDEKKDKRHDRVYLESGLGMYEWDGEYAQEAVFKLAGLAKILAIVCRDQGLTDEGAVDAVAHSAKEVAVKILKAHARDPNALRPVLEALGLPLEWIESGPSKPSGECSPTPPSTTDSTTSGDSPTTNSSSTTTSSAAPTG